MFDVNSINKRYFDIKIEVEDDDGNKYGTHLEVEPPKIKVLKKISAFSKTTNDDAMDDLAEAIKMILNKNKSREKVQDELIDNLNLDQMNGILTEYFNWIAKEKNSKN